MCLQARKARLATHGHRSYSSGLEAVHTTLLRWALVGFAGLFLGMAPARAQTCATDANCAAPLTCKPGSKICSASGGMLPDGGTFTTEPVCENGPATCTWTLVPCTADSECTSAQWKCLAPPSDPVPHFCFPEGILCAAGQACPAGWSCIDFSAVARADLADMWSPNGQTQYCFPDVLRGVADKTAQVDSSAVSQNTSSGSSGTTTGTAGTTGTAKTTSSGCALGGHRPAAWPWCLLAGLAAARLLRRRR